MSPHPQVSLHSEGSATAGLMRVSAVIKPVKSGGFLAQEIKANLKHFPHCLLLTRVGQFYEVTPQLNKYLSLACSNTLCSLTLTKPWRYPAC